MTRLFAIALCVAALAAVAALLFLAPRDDAPRADFRDARSKDTSRDSIVGEIARADSAITSTEPAREATLEEIADLARTDPGAAVRLAANVPDDEARAAVLHECLPQWLASDADGARAWLRDAGVRFSHELLLALSRDVAGTDPDFALALVQRLPSGLRGAATAGIFETWAATNPAAAAQRARTLAEQPRDPREVAGAETTDREAAITHVSRLWADRDPKAAQAWALTLSEPALRRAAIESLFATWSAADPAAAASGVLALPPAEPGRIRLIDRVVAKWAAADATAALDWVQNLAIPAERDAAAATLLSEVVQTQPADAADWALHLSRDAASPLVEKVLAAWAARDRPGAIAWASALPPGPARDTRLRELSPPK